MGVCDVRTRVDIGEGADAAKAGACCLVSRLTDVTAYRWSEINACQKVFPLSDHQLCYWHVLKAIKGWLAILRRQPAHYNVAKAQREFSLN